MHSFSREIRQARYYRLLAPPPLTVGFPSVTYQLEIQPTIGCPQWALEATATTGRRWVLCHQGQERAWLERELYQEGFEIMAPTVGSVIMDRLCAEGRAERMPRPARSGR